MTRCPTCGQTVESGVDKYQRHVFVWSTMTVLIWGMTLFSAEWTVAFWAARWEMAVIFACLPIVALYFWLQLFRERKQQQQPPKPHMDDRR